MSESLGDRIEQFKDEITQLEKDKRRLDDQYRELTVDYEKNREELTEEKEQREKLKTQVKTLEEQIEATLHELQTTRENLGILQQAVEQISQPPLAFCVILGVNPDGTADVYLESDRVFRVGVGPDVDKNCLTPGTFVMLEGKNSSVVAICESPLQVLMGEVMIYTGPQGNDHALVENASEDRVVVMKIPGMNLKDIPGKAKVRVWKRILVGVVNEEEIDTKLSKSRYLQTEIPDVTFDDIGGLDEECRRIQDWILDRVNYPFLMDLHNLPKSNRVILHGPPGNGKTTIIRAIARLSWDMEGHKILPHAQGNLMYIGGAEMLIKWVGDVETGLRNVKDFAVNLHKKSGAQIYVIFDDCESFFKQRGTGVSSDVNDSVVTTLLPLIEGFSEIVGVHFFWLSNRIEMLDEGLVSRTRNKIFIPPPTTPERALAVFQKQLKRVPLDGTKGMPQEDATGIIRQFAETIVGEIFEDKESNYYMEVSNPSDNTSEIFCVSDMLSGRLIRDVVDYANEQAFKRSKAGTEKDWPSGITLDDLRKSVEKQLLSNEGLPSTRRSFIDWLKQNGFSGDIEDVRIKDLRTSRRRLADKTEPDDIQ